MNQAIRIKTQSAFEVRPFNVYTHRQIDKITALQHISKDLLFEMKVVANVLPFRVNDYVIEQLIDWDNIPNDPIFQLTFPQREMLKPESFARMADLVKKRASRQEIQQLAAILQSELNPHPAGQMELNVPKLNGEALSGMQHKYKETVLFFPSQGQVCHAYCTFCFRWAQ
ncbi:MAG: lysine 2,3-aminomutase, partial [Pseudomonadales bacterium]|nr:lysine 2,3-aminomutase [Pseudomonadales bacterium]